MRAPRESPRDFITKLMARCEAGEVISGDEFLDTGAVFLKYIERAEKIMDIADKYLADLKDTSERLLEAQQELKENEEKFIAIFQQAPVPILILDGSYRIVDVNQGFEQVFGFCLRDVSGEKIDDLDIHLTTQDLGRMMICGRGDLSCRPVMNLRTNQGTVFSAEVSISCITLQEEPSYIIQIHDIDEIKKAHETVIKVNHKLQMLSSITRHDILNRVMVISGYSELLQADSLTQIQAKQIHAILQSTRDIRGFIDFSREYEMLGSRDPAWHQVDALLKATIIQDLLSGIRLDSFLGALEVYADSMIERVLYNLVENSLRHGRQLTWITFTMHPEGRDLCIWYEDDGGGIPQEEKERVFQRGYGKNTGLGLFLIREILSLTGITIRETGDHGIGVRFEILVPEGKFRSLGEISGRSYHPETNVNR